VWCPRNSYTFAARDFSLSRGASDAHTLHGSGRSEQRRLREKDLPPGGLRRFWLLALLLLGHRSLGTCSLVAPSQKPKAAQQMCSYFGDTTLAFFSPVTLSRCHAVTLSRCRAKTKGRRKTLCPNTLAFSLSRCHAVAPGEKAQRKIIFCLLPFAFHPFQPVTLSRWRVRPKGPEKNNPSQRFSLLPFAFSRSPASNKN